MINSIDNESKNVLIYTLSIDKCGCGGTGRRAGLRNQCQRRGGSSPFIRTKLSNIKNFINFLDIIFLVKKMKCQQFANISSV